MTRQSLAVWLHSQPALTRLLPATGQLRDVMLLVGGNVLKLGLGFGTSIVIFRTLGPSDAGRLTLTFSILGLLSIVGEFGLRDAAVNYIARWLPVTPDSAAAVARNFFISKLVLCALASTMGIFLAGWIASSFYPTVDVADLIRLGAVSLFMDGLLAFAMVVLEAQQKFPVISALGVIQALLRAGLVILLFVFHQVNLYTLLILESLIPFAVFVYSLRHIPRSFYALRVPLFEHAGLLWHFTKWVALAALASTIFLKLDVLLLSFFRTPAEVGFYAVALALVGKLDVFKSAVLTTAFPEACRRSEKWDLRLYIGQSLRMTGAASLAFLALFAFGGFLIDLFYGVEYHAAIPAFYPILAAFLVGLNAEPAAYVLYPLNQVRWIAASDASQLVFCVAANIILIPAYGIVGAAWGLLLTRMVGALITFLLVRKFLW